MEVQPNDVQNILQEDNIADISKLHLNLREHLHMCY